MINFIIYLIDCSLTTSETIMKHFRNISLVTFQSRKKLSNPLCNLLIYKMNFGGCCRKEDLN